MNDWLKLLLEEVRRRRKEAEEQAAPRDGKQKPGGSEGSAERKKEP